MPLSVTRAGITRPTAEELNQAREEFARQHCVLFEQFFEPALFEWIRAQLAGAPFVTRVHEELIPPARDAALADPLLLSKLFVLMNDARLFEVVRAITGCDAIAGFLPVVMRQDPAEALDSWHGDVDGNRLVALSINLGDRFDGGILQLRERATERIVGEGTNAEPNSALLFRISPNLHHRVAPLMGTVPRMVLAGWFLRALVSPSPAGRRRM